MKNQMIERENVYFDKFDFVSYAREIVTPIRFELFRQFIFELFHSDRSA